MKAMKLRTNYEGNFQGGVVGGGPLVTNLILFSREQ